MIQRILPFFIAAVAALPLAASEAGSVPSARFDGEPADEVLLRDLPADRSAGWDVGGAAGPQATWRHLDPALRGSDGAEPFEADGLAEAWGRVSVGHGIWAHALVQADTLRQIPSPGRTTDRWGMWESQDGNWQAQVAEAYAGFAPAGTGTTVRAGRLPQWIGLPGGTVAESWRVRTPFIAWNRATPDGVQADQLLGGGWSASAIVARQVFAPEQPSERKDTFDLAYGAGVARAWERGWATIEAAFDDSVSHDLRRDRHAHVLAFSLNGAYDLDDATSLIGDLGWGRNPDSDQYLVQAGVARRLAPGLTATLQGWFLPQIVRGSVDLDDRIASELAATLWWSPVAHVSLGLEGAVIRTDAKDASGETIAAQALVVF